MIKLKSISVIVFIAISMQLSSCCMGVKCDCLDDMDASIGLTFNMDSSSVEGFKRSEIENALFIKYNQSGVAIDTSSLGNYSGYYEYYFNINNYTAAQVKTYQDTCTYRVINETGNVDLLISDIAIKGDFAGGCCDCYHNENISFKVNGVTQYFEGKNRSGATYAINKK
ncbi:MAG: hypothetical protein ACOVP1_12860 [Bacteroidia bacterium]